MNTVIDAILKRRSIKAYTGEQVTDEELEQILNCGLYAPNGRSAQAPVFVAVRDKQTRDLLSKLNARVISEESDPFYGAPCVICVLADSNRSTAVEDGSLCIGCRQVFDSDDGKALLEKWGVPGDLIGVGFCIVGHSAQQKEAAPRKENRVFYID